jgi:bifunctional non-homologous end joining protein LigD
MNIEPMLLGEVNDDSILNKGWIYQIKQNGVRAIIHVKNHRIVGIRGRSNNPLLYCYPELKDEYFDFDTAILDAEICVLDSKGKSVFYNGINQRKTTPTTSRIKEYPITIIVFDVIQLETDVLINKPYKERLGLLQGYKWSNYVRLIESVNDGTALWNKVLRDDEEGLVAKDPNAIYELGKRSTRYLKYKNYKYADVLVEQIEPNPKGTKIRANIEINGCPVEVNCHQAGCFNINVGDTVRVKYLDIVDGKMIQPTRW